MQPDQLTLDSIETPIGVARLVTDAAGYLRSFDWVDYVDRQLKLLRRYNGEVTLTPGTAPTTIRRAIRAYFDGDLQSLGTIPWRTPGSDFQLECWNALCAIPAGETLTYGSQAAKIGRPNAMRAVGLANGGNPIAVIVPCHRVIGASGSLTGYGCGIWRKRWLLRHEGFTAFQDSGDLFDHAEDLRRALPRTRFRERSNEA
ncbi:methylated-DNA--[protein]-cysteine S-methyltransferase [Methylocella sp.]|uniref:methylated-DNA--[protein]-cysteine S-methyltransferase n=1 Tax=Methylocella sp. TaxID=1978226 RepID=UPI0035AD9C05